MLMVATALAFGHWMTESGIPNQIVGFVVGHGFATWQFLLIINGLLRRRTPALARLGHHPHGASQGPCGRCVTLYGLVEIPGARRPRRWAAAPRCHRLPA